MKLKTILYLLLILIPSMGLLAQDDLMDMLEEEVGESTEEVAYTFKSTRVINGHSIERMKQQQLDFRINHRFGEINQGWYELWGLDNAFISFDFGYGITDWMMVGIRRSTWEKTYDGSLKFSIFRQTKGARNFPVAISTYSSVAYHTLKGYIEEGQSKSLRMSYTNQILVARKFNEVLSLQLTPSYVHKNLVDFDEENDIFAVGIGGRVKFARRIALTFEYFWTTQAMELEGYYAPLSFGFDIETGGHVFQLFLTNSRVMEESGFLSDKNGNWLDGDIFFGFNISRVFAVGKKH